MNQHIFNVTCELHTYINYPNLVEERTRFFEAAQKSSILSQVCQMLNIDSYGLNEDDISVALDISFISNDEGIHELANDIRLFANRNPDTREAFFLVMSRNQVATLLEYLHIHFNPDYDESDLQSAVQIFELIEDL